MMQVDGPLHLWHLSILEEHSLQAPSYMNVCSEHCKHTTFPPVILQLTQPDTTFEQALHYELLR